MIQWLNIDHFDTQNIFYALILIFFKEIFISPITCKHKKAPALYLWHRDDLIRNKGPLLAVCLVREIAGDFNRGS